MRGPSEAVSALFQSLIDGMDGMEGSGVPEVGEGDRRPRLTIDPRLRADSPPLLPRSASLMG